MAAKKKEDVEYGGADKPFTVQVPLRIGGPKPDGTRNSDPLFFDAKEPIKSVIADATMRRLKRETAVNLVAGHMELIRQVLGLEPADLVDVASLVAGHFARLSGAAALDPLSNLAVDSPSPRAGGG